MPDAPTVIVENGRSQVILQVRQGQGGSGFDEAAGLGQIAGEKAPAMATVFQDALEQSREERQGEAVGGPPSVAMRDDHIQMILQVLADAGQFMDQWEAVSL